MTNSMPVQNLSNGRSILYEAYSNDTQYLKLSKAIRGYQGFDKKAYAKELEKNSLAPESNDQEALSKKLNLLRPFVQSLIETGITNEQEKVQLVSDYLISKFDKETGTTFKIDALLQKIVKKTFLSPEAKETKKKDKELKKAEEQKILQVAEEKKRVEELYKQTPEYKISTINKEIGVLNAGYKDIFQEYLKELTRLLIGRRALEQISDRLKNSLGIQDQTADLRGKLSIILDALSKNNLEELLKQYDPSLMAEETLDKLILEVDGNHYFSSNDILELQSIPKELGELVNNARNELNPLKKQLDEKNKELEELLPPELLSEKQVEIGPEVKPGNPKDNIHPQNLLDDPRNYDFRELQDDNPQPTYSSNDDGSGDELARAIALSLQQDDQSANLDYEKAMAASIKDAEVQVQQPNNANQPVVQDNLKSSNVEKPAGLPLGAKTTQVERQVLNEVKPAVQKSPELEKPAETVVKATKEANLVAQEQALSDPIQAKQENKSQTEQKKKKVSLFKRFCNGILKPFRAIAAFLRSIRRKYLP